MTMNMESLPRFNDDGSNSDVEDSEEECCVLGEEDMTENSGGDCDKLDITQKQADLM